MSNSHNYNPRLGYGIPQEISATPLSGLTRTLKFKPSPSVGGIWGQNFPQLISLSKLRQWKRKLNPGAFAFQKEIIIHPHTPRRFSRSSFSPHFFRSSLNAAYLLLIYFRIPISQILTSTLCNRQTGVCLHNLMKLSHRICNKITNNSRGIYVLQKIKFLRYYTKFCWVLEGIGWRGGVGVTSQNLFKFSKFLTITTAPSKLTIDTSGQL